jgi:hypothetical protein
VPSFALGVAEYEPALGELFDDGAELGGAEVVVAAAEAFHDAGTVGVGLEATDRPEAGVAEGAVIEVHGVLGGEFGAAWASAQGSRWGMQRYSGFSAKQVSEEALGAFPHSVVPEERRKRTYWNGVFARAEAGSSYCPARRLWVREKMGNYVPSDVRVRVAAADGKPEQYVSLRELLAMDLLEGVFAAEVVVPASRSFRDEFRAPREG